MVGREPPWLQGENAALALRHRLRLGDAPVNVWEIIRQVGVNLALHDFGEHAGDGLYIRKGDQALILINTAQRPSRQRFTAAHELGHHEMHRHERRNVVITDKDVYGKDSTVEKAANAFAANLLAPGQALVDELDGKNRKELQPDDVVALMVRFGLSYQATCYRLKNTGVITKPKLDELLTAGDVEYLLAVAGVDEAALFPPGQALPRYYVDHTITLWQHRVITDERFAEMLRMTPEDADRFRREAGVGRPDLPDFEPDALGTLLGEAT